MDLNKEVTIEILREFLDYDPNSGVLRWKVRGRHHFPSKKAFAAWNSRYAGTVALNAVHNNGYKVGSVFYRRLYAHRVAWAIMHGKWPDFEIDHIDRNRANNKISNLADIAHKENCRNTGMRSGNVSGHKYISRDSTRGKWLVMVQKKNLGRFDNLSAAIAVRDAAVPVEFR